VRSDSSSFPCSRAGGREIQWAAASAGSASSRGGGGGGRELQEGRRRPRVAERGWPLAEEGRAERSKQRSVVRFLRRRSGEVAACGRRGEDAGREMRVGPLNGPFPILLIS
jgi:hypothetical protein